MQLGSTLARRLAAALVVACAAVPAASANVTVTGSTDANALAQAFAGPGVTIVPGSATLQGAAAGNDPFGGPFGAQQGTFTSTLTNTLGFNSGVVLTSGTIDNVPGPNDSTSAGRASLSGTNAQLSTLAGGAIVNDANTLTFSFTVPAGTGGVGFQYVFASEEYNEFANSTFNDVFGFFVDGQNVALIPGTTTPVSINTVNGGDFNGGFGPTPAVNPQFYINNDPINADGNGNLVDPANLRPIEADGLTTVLTANVFAALNPNLAVHTISLAVGDVGDSSYDSQVFLRADSFLVPEPGVALFGLAAAAGLLFRKRK